jgi:hypothetical protein
MALNHKDPESARTTLAGLGFFIFRIYMAKKTTLENENVYFPHFIGARHDRKIKRARKELGIEGYGIYFMLLELLREQSDLKYPMDDIDLIADEFETSEQKIRVVICNYGLFEVDKDELFFSPKQIEYLQPYFAKSKRAKHAALTRWNKLDANAMQMQSASNANAMQGKESKVKESKEKDRLIDQKQPARLDDNFLDEISIQDRDKIIIDYLSTTILSQSEKEMFVLRLASNNYCKFISGNFHRMKLSQIRPEAEYCKKQGWLKVNEEDKPKAVGGLFT